jgi:glycosyltransferase involved in cell wall biosynthesis
LVAVSAALRDELVALGVPDKRVNVMRNGVDMERFTLQDRAAMRRQLGLPDVPTLLVVSHLKEDKGHRLVFEALRLIPDAILLVVGDGPQRKALERSAESSRVAERVRFCGTVPQEKLPEYYNAADVLVLASRREGMPNVVLESIACGTPVVATAVGGVPEIITQSAAGVLVDSYSDDALAAAITSLLESPPERSATRRHAEGFSWKETTQQQIDLFERLVAHPKASV